MRFSNIEPSSFRYGEYVGYAKGVWSIQRSTGHKWEAHHTNREAVAPTFYARTPTEMNAHLVAWASGEIK